MRLFDSMTHSESAAFIDEHPWVHLHLWCTRCLSIMTVSSAGWCDLIRGVRKWKKTFEVWTVLNGRFVVSIAEYMLKYFE